MRSYYWPLIFLGVLIAGGIFVVQQKFKTRSDFRKKILPDALKVESETGVNHQIILTQAEHESGAGNSELSLKYFNLFGIKANQKWIQNGKPYATLVTKEVINGQEITTKANFRQYANFLESIRDYAKFLQSNFPVAYAAAQKNDINAFVAGLKNGVFGSYATDPNYGPQLAALYSNLIKEVA
jgi:flagellum-specific peptidoglycan hydrolase FlgJ